MSDLSKDLLSLAPTNRRGFVRNIGLASAAASIVASSNTAEAQSTSPTDIDILNFALNLEYLEAEFYTYAVTGGGITNFAIAVTGSGTPGATTGGSFVPFTTAAAAQVAEELAADERFHVALLQNTIALLGGTAIAKPPINLGALGIGFGSQNAFLTVSRALEEIGVTAYGGAAPLITNKTVLGYAARILATEAEHVGLLRSFINLYSISVTALDSVDVIPPPVGNQFFSTNSNAITAVRTPGQVLYLAFGGTASATSGGFFPAGVNGNLNAAAATPAVTDGVTFTLSPNPAVGVNGFGTVTVTWNAPSATYIEVRIGNPYGPLFTVNTNSGSMQTGAWVTEGMLFYLQDVSYPKGGSLTAANTLAVAIARVH